MLLIAANSHNIQKMQSMLTACQCGIQNLHLGPVAELKGAAIIYAADVVTGILYLHWTKFQFWENSIRHLRIAPILNQSALSSGLDS